jgi:hypothetical protein
MLGPSVSSNAIWYARRQLAQRAGIVSRDPTESGFEALSVPVYYGHPVEVSSAQPAVFVVPCGEDAWKELLALPDHSLDWLSQDRVLPSGAELPFGDAVPVLFWGDGYEDGNKPFAERLGDGSIIFYADIFAVALFMLSRWEETVVSTLDDHDRFPAAASVAYRQGFLDRPIVDEYALILREWLKVIRPRFEPVTRRFSVRLSHDVDDVRRFSWPYRIGRAIGIALRRRRALLQYGRDFVSLLRSPDPFTGIYQLADLSEQYGFSSAFYFQAAESGAYDRGYDLASRHIRGCVNALRERGHEIGFHGGYRAFADRERLLREKARFERSLDQPARGGRQHYLRFIAPQTWRIWEEVGLEYDSTLGFADHEGFRCGSCHPFRPFDLEKNRELDLLEVPLLVMDGTLRRYRGLTPQQGKDVILKIAQRCYQVNGVFTMLWHNSSLEGEWQPWFAMYQHVLRCLAAMEEQSVGRREMGQNAI